MSIISTEFNTALNFTIFDNEVTTEGKRFYYVGNKAFPSVTTLLSKYEDKDFLVKWQQRLGKKNADAHRDKSASRGIKTHALIESYQKDRNSLNKVNRNSSEEEKYAKNAIQSFYGVVDTLGVEECIIYEDKVIRYAGRVDTIANIVPNTFYYASDLSPVAPGLAIVDLKTKDKSQPINIIDRMFKYALQGAAYIKGLEFSNNVHVDYFIIVYSYKTKSRSVLFNRELIEYYFNIFYQYALCYSLGIDSVYSWKDFINMSNAYLTELGDMADRLPEEIIAFNKQE